MRLRTLLALALMAALGTVAAVAVAAPPPGKGKPDRPAAAAKAEAKASAKAARVAKLKAKRLARLQAKEETAVLENCRPRVSYVLKGTFVSASDGSLAMLVQRSNKHAKAFVGKQVTLTLGERSRVRGVGLARAQAGSKVVAHVRGCKDKGESVELYAKHVVVTRAKGDKGGEDDGETGSTSTSTETSTTESTTTESTESTTTETTP